METLCVQVPDEEDAAPAAPAPSQTTAPDRLLSVSRITLFMILLAPLARYCNVKLYIKDLRAALCIGLPINFVKRQVIKYTQRAADVPSTLLRLTVASLFEHEEQSSHRALPLQPDLDPASRTHSHIRCSSNIMSCTT